VVERQSISLGGCAFNSANIIRQLGQSYRLFAPIGKGVYADYISSELASRGIQALTVNTTIDCGSCICMVEPNGERTMLTMPGIDRHFSAAWFDSLGTNNFGSALIYGYEIEGSSGDTIVSFAEQLTDTQIVYAPGPRICGISQETTNRINALRPVWHLNDLEACNYTGLSTIQEAGQAILEQCDNTVIITQGAKGSHLFFEDGYRHIATKAIKPVDTIGAGDAHIGAILAARSAGHDWETAIQIANRVSSAICEIPGSTFTDADFNQLGIVL
jgi:sugar/nucleoside kinase (ribokinase family)